MLMTEVLDPYREWLDVQAPDRPLNAYQLLGLNPGEPVDERDIDEAVRQKRQLLHRISASTAPALWRRLNHELNEAFETLRDPQAKAAYDRRLFPAGIQALNRQPTGPLTCGGCQNENPPGRGFCASCGESLMQPCARCGASNISSENYCGACGSNLRAVLQERIENFEARLQEADTLQADGHFDDALVLLSSMLSTSLAALEPRVEQARQMLRELPARRSAAEQRYAEALEQAERLAAACDYDGAIAAYEESPPGLRTAAFQESHRQWQARRDEIDRLTRTIRAAVMAKKTDGLLEQVEQLLTLKPGHAQALKLQQQLTALKQRSDAQRAADLRRGAKRLLSEHNYAQAVKQLEETPEALRDADFEKIYAFAKETAWLSKALTTAPVADRGLHEAALRLCKLAPKDERAARAVKEIQAAMQRGPADPRQAAPVWKPPSSQLPLQFSVQWLGGFQRLQPTAACNTELLRRHPGCFYVACGLALQGLGLAAVATNLAPAKKTGGLLGSLRGWRRSAAPAAAWGIDVSNSGLKAVRLVCGEATNDVKIDSSAVVEVAFDGPAPGAPEQVAQRLRSLLESFLQKHTIGNERVCLSVGGAPLLGRFFRIPAVDEDQVPDAVRYEMRQQVPVPLEELTWDFQAFPPSPDPDDPRVSQREIVALAAQPRQLKATTEVLEHLGLEAHVLQSDAAALANFARFEFENEFPVDDDNAAAAGTRMLTLLDVGRETSNFVTCSPRGVFFRTLPIGGDLFTKALVREFKLTFAEAEQLKRAPWKARSMQQWDAALLPVFSNLVDDVRRHAQMTRRGRVERLYVCGGGAQVHGLVRWIHHAALAAK